LGHFNYGTLGTLGQWEFFQNFLVFNVFIREILTNALTDK